ncbi:PREDICTED: GTPase IMAP family member 8-like [Cyprinodon variegatus]|uniref:GTPase IMAP family member 8-like n=1 Tax=Cyprinodon variegatus TaxID=28743 RepID=A0A3Q2E8H0_CYPVA|nr:PREDICTED: GTPase IMAP family member 8-like [Cyprinodon variegatus]
MLQLLQKIPAAGPTQDEVDMDPEPEADLTVVLLGNSGVGKSASGNTILGRDAFQSKASFCPGTVPIRTEVGRVFGKWLQVVDTAGILEFEEQIQSHCEKLLQTFRPVLFLLVLKVDRFTTEQRESLEAAIRVVGDGAFSCCFLLFTHGDSLRKTSLQDFIFQDQQSSLPEVARRFCNRVHLFNNQNREGWQVQELLEKAGLLEVPAAAGPDVDRVGNPDRSVRLTERRIILVGPAGSGKSSAGNVLLGFRRFEPDCDFHGTGRPAESGSVELDGFRLTVVDSSGPSDEDLTLDRLVQKIRSSMVLAEPGPHVLVIVVKIGRVSASDSRLFRLLTRSLDRNLSKHGVVLFTHGDALGGRSVQDQVGSSGCVLDLLSRCEGRHCVLDSTRTGDHLQVERFLRLIEQTIQKNSGCHCSPDSIRTDPKPGHAVFSRTWTSWSRRARPAGPGLLKVLSVLVLLLNNPTYRYLY